ncbi:MAG TPA: TonB-dependent receptor [Thermoanaerobaculia bacterium]|nr:TonB-dependent receptor [Thermoanaerobaculia bacterium]
MRHLRLGFALSFILTAALIAQAQNPVTIEVLDSSGAAVPRARVAVLTAGGATVNSGRADDNGRYTTDALAAGRYVLEIEARGFATQRELLEVTAGMAARQVTLDPARIEAEVIVTATPGVVQEAGTLTQPVNTIDREEIDQRAWEVISQVANEEAGLALQRTSQVMSGIYVRGLTGNKVNVYVDGVRYTHAGQRGGVNTFLNLNDPSFLDEVEVLRGPSSAQYGSDALGGSIQLLTHTPVIGGSGVSGRLSLLGGSADSSYGTSLDASWSGRTVGATLTLTRRHFGDLRSGGGFDSHNAVTRFLGVHSDVAIDERLPGTGFDQLGANLKIAWAATDNSQLTASYTRGEQDDGKRYDQLLGGDGNLIADLRGLALDFGYLRYDMRNVGPADHVSVGYSYNAQREERVNQGGNGNPNAAINHEYERTTVHGVQGSAMRQVGRHSFGAGVDGYFERVKAPSYSENPVSGAIAVRRGRVPDQAKYATTGIYLQDAFDVSSRLLLTANLRYSRFSYESRASASPVVNGRRLWPDDELDVSAFSYRVGALARATDALSFTASVSTGFRAPHTTDLATLGLTGDGFEVAAPDVAGLGGHYGSSAAATAADSGRPVEQLKPERSLNLEGGVRWSSARVDAELSVFQNKIHDNITKQALILPQGAVGTTLGDQMIVRQDANGVVYVPVTAGPVLVRANFDDATIRGIENTLRVQLAPAWSFSSAITYLRAEDDRTGLPPNIEGGTPAPDGWFKLRFAPQSRRYWVEPYLHVALEQDHLSSLDLADRRTGATRSRNAIAGFFNNGARARGLIGNGPDGLAGTSDDILLATGETLAQIQARLLGTASSAPLYTSVDGYTTIGVRGSLRFGKVHEVLVDLQNLTDENYRGISWGIDAPGRGIYVRYQLQF